MYLGVRLLYFIPTMARHLLTISRALLLLPLLIGLGCADLDTGPQLADQEVRNALPSQEFTNATLVHTKRADTTFVLQAPVIYRNDLISRADLFGGITITFYRDGYPGTVLTADSGAVLRDGKEMEAYGDVVVETDSGLVLYTERMRWADADHLIRSDTTVTLITEEDTLYGDGLVATEDLKQRRISNATGVSWRTAGRDSTGQKQARVDPFFEADKQAKERNGAAAPDDSTMIPDSLEATREAEPESAEPQPAPPDTASSSRSGR